MAPNLKFIAVAVALAVGTLGCAEEWKLKTFPELSEAECKSRGGDFYRIGIPGGSSPPECNLPTKDSGALCTSSVQCEGYCLGPDDAKHGAFTSGKCSERQKLVACRVYVEGWRAQH